MRIVLWVPFAKKSYILGIDTDWIENGIAFQSRIRDIHLLVEIHRNARYVNIELETPNALYSEQVFY